MLIMMTVEKENQTLRIQRMKHGDSGLVLSGKRQSMLPTSSLAPSEKEEKGKLITGFLQF